MKITQQILDGDFHSLSWVFRFSCKISSGGEIYGFFTKAVGRLIVLFFTQNIMDYNRVFGKACHINCHWRRWCRPVLKQAWKIYRMIKMKQKLSLGIDEIVGWMIHWHHNMIMLIG